MRIFAVADIHNRDVGKLEVEDVDVVIVAGDFTNADGVDFAKETVKKLEENFPEAKILAVPGNMDVKEVLDFLEEKGVSIHGKVVEVNGVKIGGLGGSNITPFRTPFELEENEILAALEGLECDIAVIHTPPFGYYDWIAGASVGSRAVREWMDRKKPKLLICAHIHEYEGTARVGDTLIVKLGAAMNGRCAIIDVDDRLNEVIVRFEKI